MLYVLSKIVKTLLSPGNLFCLLLVAGGVMVVLPGARAQKIGRRLCFAVAITALLIAVLPLGYWAVQKLENRFPATIPARVDGIILLAGGENPAQTDARGQAALRESAPRYLTFAGLARKYPEARLAYIGGNNALSPYQGMTNEGVARLALTDAGVPLGRVKFEAVSHNTYENATYGFKAIKPKPGENWLLVTSAAHMPRALLTFRKAGWHVFPAPAGYDTSPGPARLVGFHFLGHFNVLHTAFYEYGGLITYWAMGRIDWPWQ